MHTHYKDISFYAFNVEVNQEECFQLIQKAYGHEALFRAQYSDG